MRGLGLTAGSIAFAAAGTAFGYLLRSVTNGGLIGIDESVLAFMAQHTGEGTTAAMKALTMLGSRNMATILVGAAGIGFFWKTKSWRPGFHIAITAGSAFILNTGVKQLVMRARPPGPHLTSVSGSSFPSGHTAEAIALYGTVALLLCLATPKWTSRVTYWVVAACIVVAVALSRVYLRVHYVTDVLGGAALGAAWLALTATAFRTWSLPVVHHSRRLRRDHESASSISTTDP